jgi:hypothetical protein
MGKLASNAKNKMLLPVTRLSGGNNSAANLSNENGIELQNFQPRSINDADSEKNLLNQMD